MHAVRISSAAFGTLCGLTGIIAGAFLILQGDSSVNAVKISYIGPEYRMWEHETYVAFTLIPNYILSGLTTLIISITLVYISLFKLHKRYGSIVFLVLSVLQLFTGGGFVIDLALITFLLSFGIRSKLKVWTRIFSNKLGKFLAVLWFPALIFYLGLSVAMLALTIAGTNKSYFMELMVVLATIMFLPIILMIFGSLAYEVKKNPSNLYDKKDI